MSPQAVELLYLQSFSAMLVVAGIGALVLMALHRFEQWRIKRRRARGLASNLYY